MYELFQLALLKETFEVIFLLLLFCTPTTFRSWIIPIIKPPRLHLNPGFTTLKPCKKLLQTHFKDLQNPSLCLSLTPIDFSFRLRLSCKLKRRSSYRWKLLIIQMDRARNGVVTCQLPSRVFL